PRRLPRELALSWEDRVDQAVADRDPVADDGKVTGAGLVVEPAGELNELLGLLRHDLPGAAVLHGDAARCEAGLCVIFECTSDLVVPAEALEIGELQADSFPARTRQAGLAGPECSSGVRPCE